MTRIDEYFRPLTGHRGPRLAGGWCRISAAERLSRDGRAEVVPLASTPVEWRHAWAAERPDLAGIALDRPVLMGVLNLTPASFTDGGKWHGEKALTHARAMLAAGAKIIDVGGESTRPGAQDVPPDQELSRILPIIEALASDARASDAVISVDTRKAQVARAAIEAGAGIVNDVSGLDFDPEMAATVAQTKASLIIMQSRGNPRTMQDDPRYDHVVCDVFDALAERVLRAEDAGIPRSRIAIDPGIGFAKTIDHNLALLRSISIFHGLRCGVVLGVSRKRFISTIGGGTPPEARDAGTHALTLAAVQQGVQIHRIHDVDGAAQSLALWQAAGDGRYQQEGKGA